MAAAKGSFPSLARCFRAWQRFVQRGAQCRRHLAHQRVRILRVCLGQWMEMKQLQASDVTKVTQLSLYRRKAGKPVANSGSGAGVGVGWGWGSLQPKLQLIKLQSPVKLMNITWERTLLSWVLGRGWGVGGERLALWEGFLRDQALLGYIPVAPHSTMKACGPLLQEGPSQDGEDGDLRRPCGEHVA